MVSRFRVLAWFWIATLSSGLLFGKDLSIERGVLSNAQVHDPVEKTKSRFAVKRNPAQNIAWVWKQTKTLFYQKRYFSSARAAFWIAQHAPLWRPQAYAWITKSLLYGQFYQSSVYFFFRTLQTRDRVSIRNVLPFLKTLLLYVEGDLITPFLERYTYISDYNASVRPFYQALLAQKYLFHGKVRKALQFLRSLPESHPWTPILYHLKGTTLAILGQSGRALGFFDRCLKTVSLVLHPPMLESEKRFREKKAYDLRARCQAGRARILYQMKRFFQADRAYDRIPKRSFVWTDILLEQAWAAYGQGQYNRVLGKLVTYQHPDLQFVFQPEIDSLRAQAYWALCLYQDAAWVLESFQKKYRHFGKTLRMFLERTQSLRAFYEAGREAFTMPLHSPLLWNQALNRFVRSSFFMTLVQHEKQLHRERKGIRYFSRRFRSRQKNKRYVQGFPEFLEQVLQWRRKSIWLLGGVFVKNNLLDTYQNLLYQFEKISLIELDVLRSERMKVMGKKPLFENRSRGNQIPERRADQYFWTFDGEYWADELGAYVFALKAQCSRAQKNKN